jgi:prepilin-type N-terminal cleavage/methylation domain-containing protein
MRAGHTLPELMLSLAVGAILLTMAVPRLIRAIDQIEVDAAVGRVVGAHQRARMMAVARGEVLTLGVDSARLSIVSRSGGAPLWLHEGPAESGVTLAGPTRHFTFSPSGVTLGLSNASLVLSRGTSVRTLVFSRLGRVRIVR